MTDSHSAPEAAILAAVDVAKDHDEALIELHGRWRDEEIHFQLLGNREDAEMDLLFVPLFGKSYLMSGAVCTSSSSSLLAIPSDRTGFGSSINRLCRRCGQRAEDRACSYRGR
jgi:hypothetical protein